MPVSCMQHMGKADTSAQSSYCTVNYVFVTQTSRLDYKGLTVKIHCTNEHL